MLWVAGSVTPGLAIPGGVAVNMSGAAEGIFPCSPPIGVMAAGLPRDLLEVLERGERVLWAARPRRGPFVLQTLPVLIVVLPFMAAPLAVFWAGGPAVLLEPFAAAFLLFWYGVLSLVALTPLYSLLVWKNVWYVLTDERVVVRKGLVGIDYDMLELGNIEQVNVNVGFVDKIYGTGTIELQAIGVKPLTLTAVEEPYRVQRIIRRAVEEAKRARAAR